MRLIDADAEIARIEQEIQRINDKIERLKKLIANEPLNTIHNFTNKLEQCYRDKADCRAEIATIRNYQTAYDVDRVVERLEANSMYVQEEIEPYVMLDDAVEIVKSGGME